MTKSSGELDIPRTNRMCTGTATAHLCQALLERSERYRPHLHDRFLYQLRSTSAGHSLSHTLRWFADNQKDLERSQLHVQHRVVAFPSQQVEKWVNGGMLRAAVLVTDGSTHPKEKFLWEHAVAMYTPSGKKKSIALDPCLAAKNPCSPADFFNGHREARHRTLLLFCAGHY